LLYYLFIVYFQFLFTFRVFLAYTLRETLGYYLIGNTYASWKDIKKEIESDWNSIDMSNGFTIPTFTYFNQFFFYFYSFLIYLRLWVYAERYLYIIGRYLVAYFLLFNHFLLATYIISLAFLMGRFILLFVDIEYSMFKANLKELREDDLEEGYSIYPTYQTSKFLLLWNVNFLAAADSNCCTQVNFLAEHDTSAYKQIEFKCNSNKSKEDIIDVRCTYNWHTDMHLEDINYPVLWRDSREDMEDKKYFEIYKNNAKLKYYIISSIIIFLDYYYNLNMNENENLFMVKETLFSNIKT